MCVCQVGELRWGRRWNESQRVDPSGGFKQQSENHCFKRQSHIPVWTKCKLRQEVKNITAICNYLWRHQILVLYSVIIIICPWQRIKYLLHKNTFVSAFQNQDLNLSSAFSVFITLFLSLDRRFPHYSMKHWAGSLISFLISKYIYNLYIQLSIWFWDWLYVWLILPTL